MIMYCYVPNSWDSIHERFMSSIPVFFCCCYLLRREPTSVLTQKLALLTGKDKRIFLSFDDYPIRFWIQNNQFLHFESNIIVLLQSTNILKFSVFLSVASRYMTFNLPSFNYTIDKLSAHRFLQWKDNWKKCGH